MIKLVEFEVFKEAGAGPPVLINPFYVRKVALSDAPGAVRIWLVGEERYIAVTGNLDDVQAALLA